LITSAGGAPPPTGGEPVLESVIVSPQRTLHPNDTLTVIATGTPGGQATFEVVGLRTPVAMAEIGAGRYQGTLPVTTGMTAQEAVLLVRLTRDGRSTTREGGTVTI